MNKKFSLYQNINKNLIFINNIYKSIKISLGPTGKNGIFFNSKEEILFLTNGSLIIKSLNFNDFNGKILLKLFEQAALKTNLISGDGSSTTIILTCELLKNSLQFILAGYNPIFISNGLKKISFFLNQRILDYSEPVSNSTHIYGIIKTNLGKKLNINLLGLLEKIIKNIDRDGLVLVEENISEENNIEIVQGFELNKGFVSSYFINNLKNFEIIYENCYLLIASENITSIDQIREVIEYVKSINKPLVIISEDISKEIISTLVLNTIQKKIQIGVIKYNSIKFIKTGILEDLSLLTHSAYFPLREKQITRNYKKEDLGQIEKVIIKKEKSIFFFSKYSKVLAKRRINELNRELLTSEIEFEREILKTRIARLSGNIIKLKIGLSTKYQIQEEKQKVERAVLNLRSALEEGIIAGGGIIYYYLQEELKNWSYLNLIGDELYSSQIVIKSLIKALLVLYENVHEIPYKILQETIKLGYPYTYNISEKTIVNSFNTGLLDSTKTLRGILWNSLNTISSLIISE
jgi:chaperonin GroEL